MKMISSLIATFLFATCFHYAHADSLQLLNETELGPTLPPIGFVEFCRREGKDDPNCASSYRGGGLPTVVMTDSMWDQLKQVNTYVNTNIRPASDMEIYGQADFWTYPVDTGDCEDYVLLKKRYLIGLGWPDRSLRITVVLDEHGEGHAALTAITNAGDLILDNRRIEILRWDRTGYTYLKRQGSDSPAKWSSLSIKAFNGNLVTTK